MLLSIAVSVEWYSSLLRKVRNAEEQLEFANKANDNLRLEHSSVDTLLTSTTLKENDDIKAYLEKYSVMSITELRAETERFINDSQSLLDTARCGYSRDKWASLLCPMIFGLLLVLIS